MSQAAEVQLSYTLQMSSKYSGPANTADALMNSNLVQGCGTNSHTQQWIQVSFGSVKVVTRIEVAGALGSMPGGWGYGYLEGRMLQYMNANGQWVDIQIIDGLQEATVKEFRIGAVNASAMRVYGGDKSYVAMGCWRVYGYVI